MLTSIFCSHCRRSEHGRTGYSIIKNAEDVGNPQLKASFVQIRSIENDWFDEGSVFFDREGDIIYWQARDGIVAKFDLNGTQVLNKKLPSGQGYGDLYFFDFEEYGGKYYVWDKKACRLNIFDKEFNLKSASNLGTSSESGKYQMRCDSRGNLYFCFDSMILPESGKWAVYSEVGIGNFGAEGKANPITYFKDRYCLLMEKPAKKYLGYFFLQPFLRYFVDDNDKVWVCDRREYKIYKYFQDGSLEMVIEKAYKKMPLKGEIEERFREEYNLKREEDLNATETVLPEYIYPVMDVLLLENGYLLVLRMDNMYRADKKGKIPVDLFDEKGGFLTQLEFPEFSGCYILNNQFKSKICYRSGRFATLESDEKLEKYRICIYELRLE